jgi:plastocyanin
MRIASVVLAVSLTLLLASCGSSEDADSRFPSPTARPAPAELALLAQDNLFEPTRLVAPAGAPVTLVFTSEDAAPHNFAIYTNTAAEEEVFVGQTFSGPGETVTYNFDAPEDPGEYFFRCDVHPVEMTGTFVSESG